MRNQEENLQKSVVDYLKLSYPKVRYCASLGGIRTSFKQAVKAKATGYVKGFPDLQVCYPTHKVCRIIFRNQKKIKNLIPPKNKKNGLLI